MTTTKEKPKRRETFWGHEGANYTPYLTRTRLFSMAKATFMLHEFHRGDGDPDPHDHPWDFVTFPLTSYVEHVYDPHTGAERLQLVKAWQIHVRLAEHIHRVVGKWDAAADKRMAGISAMQTKPGKVWSIVMRGEARRDWLFWPKCPGCRQHRIPVPWKTYIAGQGRSW